MELAFTYEITIGNYRLSSSANNRLVQLSVDASLVVPVNTCTMWLPLLEDMPLTREMPVVIKLGYRDNNTKAFTGRIHQIEQQLSIWKITVLSSFHTLVTQRKNLYFEQSTAGVIVADLCQEAGITPARIDPGLQFPFYALGNRQSLYQHLRQLADKCGFSLFADENDQLFFGVPVPQLPTVFELGANILALKLEDKPTSASQVEVYGESPASFGQGITGASWLTKKEVKGTAGSSSSPGVAIPIPAIRTLDGAQSAAVALQQKWKARKTGRLKVLGAAAIKLGQLVKINQLPSGNLTDVFTVVGISHLVQAEQGFLTTINIQEV